MNWQTLLIAGWALLQSHATDWPQFRGRNRDGHSPETGLLKEWPKDGPKLLWHSKEVGGGFSSPSIGNGRVYLLGSEGTDREFLTALSEKDGHRLWTLSLGKVGHPEQEPKYPGSRSTPTVDRDRVYALGSDGDLVCAEAATGKEVWRKHLQRDFGGKHGEWAYAESPLVDGDHIVCTPGGKEATIVALDKRSGETVWKCALPEGDDAAYACIVPAEFSGVRQYVQFLARSLVGLDPKTGKLLWRYERTAKGSPAVIVTPLVSDGLIYSGAFMAVGALVKPVKKDHGFEIEEVYANNKLPIGSGGVVKVGDQFYGNGTQAFMCVDFKTGKVLWEERYNGVSLLAANDNLYAHLDNGSVTLIDPSPEGLREKSRFTPANRPAVDKDPAALAYPALSNGRLYIREQNNLWSYDVRAK